jgi:hypothetical protein
MKQGDMEQFDYDDPENGWAWRSMLYFGIGFMLMLSASMAVGIFLGWLIWGI